MLYGIEVFTGRENSGLRLGRRLYDYSKELCERLNLKAIVIGDVDLDLLRELNQFGSVKNLRDRRKDVYKLTRNKTE